MWATCRCRPASSFRNVVRTQYPLHRKQQRERSSRQDVVQTRRTVLLSVGFLFHGLGRVARAEENGAVTNSALAEAQESPKRLRSEAGYEFVYPASWIVAFERGGSATEGTMTFVGNFLKVDTFSVEKFPRDVTASLESLAQETVLATEQSSTSMAFANLGRGYVDTEQGPGSLYVVEYDVETCKGLVTESLGGKKICRDAKDAALQSVARHHLLGLTQTDDAVFYLRASCPSSRWEAVKSDLWMVMYSFVTR